MNLKCQKCGFEWQYQGRKKVFATCPDCMQKTPVQENETKGELKDDGQNRSN